MDLLQKELQRKKLALAKAKMGAGLLDMGKKRKKYMRQSDLRRAEEEEEKQRQQAASKRSKKEDQEASSSAAAASRTKEEAEDKSTKAKTKSKTRTTDESNQPSSKTTSQSTDNNKSNASAALQGTSAKSITQQLRNFGLPIRYFGETHEQRLQRLQQALKEQTQALQGLSEREEFQLGKGHGIRNPFLERDDQGGKDSQKEKKAKREEEKEEETTNDADEDDPVKRIYKYLKGLLKNWESDLEERPDIVARSVAGRNESKTLKQCKDYIRPLFRLLKKRQLEAGLQAHLIKIVDCALEGEFVRSHDAYMDLAIGRAAWPIGVTMVGIHARTGRAKIESSNVAHVMNSELQRKYLTSVKRLLSYAQKKRTDVDPSKKVG